VVRWSDGSRQRLEGVDADRLLVIEAAGG